MPIDRTSDVPNRPRGRCSVSRPETTAAIAVFAVVLIAWAVFAALLVAQLGR